MNHTELNQIWQINLISKTQTKIWLQPIWVIITLGKTSSQKFNYNKFKISAQTWDDTFDLPDNPYSIADIQDYFEFIIKKHETSRENPPIQIYPNKIKNRIVLKIKTGEINS